MTSKKVNQGGERLFSKSEWCDPTLLHGTDLDICGSPVLADAFDRVMSQFQPRHTTALMALCCSTRPYSKTDTWKELIRLANGKADPVVTSNGGIIPIEFESEWPFLTYDAPGSKEYDAEYIELLTKRLTIFLATFHYDKVVFVFMPKKRNRAAAKAACDSLCIEYQIVPSSTTWQKLAKRVPSKFNRPGRNIRTEQYKVDGFLWKPLAHPLILEEVAWRIGK